MRTQDVRATILLLLIAWLFLVPRALAAETADIAAVVGFTDTFNPGRWTPLSITVTNRGRDFSGELEVQVTAGNELRGRPFVTSHRRPLELQRGARKTLQFTVLPQSLFHPLVIRVISGGRVEARAELDLRARHVAYERLLLVLSRDANMDYLNDRADDGTRVLYPHPELLPAHWRGYDAVAAVVVHGVSLERLSAVQFEALRKWIAQGGILAVSGGTEYTLLRTPRLAALLPGTPAGITRVDPAVAQASFASLELSQPIPVHRLDAISGQTRMRAGEVPLVLERTLGFGRVLYLTFDVAAAPFDRWPGMRAMWMDTLRLPLPAAGAPSVADPGSDASLLALIRAQSADFAHYGVVLLFLLLYLGLLVVLYQRQAFEARFRTLATLGSWAVPALFALAAWLVFGPAAHPRGASSLAVALIEPFADGAYARLELDLGMYANRSGVQRFEYRGAELTVRPRQAQRGAQAGDWAFGDGSRPYLEPQDPRRYVLHTLQAEDVIAFDLKASVHDDAAGPRLALDNASGRALENLLLVFAGHAYDLGSVAEGAKLERRLDRQAHGVALDKVSWQALLKPPAGMDPQMLEPVRIVLERKAKTSGDKNYPGAGRALLLAHTASPLRPAGTSAHWPRRERAVVAMQIAALPNAANLSDAGRLERSDAGIGSRDSLPVNTVVGGGNDVLQSASR